MSLSVDILRDVENSDLPSDEEITAWANLAAAERSEGAELCIRILSESESQELNRDYRGKDKPTNVLSFPFEAPPGLPINILGDLAICADIVTHEANEQGKRVQDHWAHMVIHGTLHLLGFDHINDDDAEIMEALERKLLASLEIPDPYAE